MGGRRRRTRSGRSGGRRDGGRAPESPGSRGSARGKGRGARGGGLACQPGNGRLSQIGALPSSPPSMEKGAAVYFLFLEEKKNLSLLLLLLSHVKLFISAAVGAADGGG